MKNMMIGVDLAKAVFQVHGALRMGEIQFRKKLTRKQFPAFMAQQDPSMVIFKACGSAHFWAREIEALGHEVKLIAPQYVRPFVKRLCCTKRVRDSCRESSVVAGPHEQTDIPDLQDDELG
jgi:transposase